MRALARLAALERCSLGKCYGLISDCNSVLASIPGKIGPVSTCASHFSMCSCCAADRPQPPPFNVPQLRHIALENCRAVKNRKRSSGYKARFEERYLETGYEVGGEVMAMTDALGSIHAGGADFVCGCNFPGVGRHFTRQPQPAVSLHSGGDLQHSSARAAPGHGRQMCGGHLAGELVLFCTQLSVDWCACTCQHLRVRCCSYLATYLRLLVCRG